MTARKPRNRRLLLVMPAFGRYELTRIVLAELAWVRDTLRPLGLDVDLVVVADDENLTEAAAHGFRTIEKDNAYLGARYNAGYQLALEDGFDYVKAQGSDSFVDPRVFLPLAHGIPLADEMMAGHYLSAFAPAQARVDPRRPTARLDHTPRRADLWIDRVFGSSLYPVGLLAAVNGRPCDDERRKGCDTSARTAIVAANPGAKIIYQDLHQLERVNFGSGVTQVTDFERLARSYRPRPRDRRQTIGRDPWKGLADHYPTALVDRVRDYYESGRAARA